MISQKHVFWEALIITICVFGIGILLGVWVENARTDKIAEMYVSSELEMLDVRLQTSILDMGDINCDNVVKENLEFADRIYFEAITLSKYENSNELTDDIVLQHKKYDLLRTQLWLNSIKIKERCNPDYVNIVYFYEYIDPSLDKKSRQGVFSKVLEDVKDVKNEEVILIPIAADLNIVSLELLKSRYGIDELPTILIDENVKITNLNSPDEILSILDNL
ncbi:MAG TPA: hypothetical protein ENG87_00120 [Candidatus Pacearchaeota archaeon]|nr:hypothetical protein BMS3Abin17_01269 [archaeon BMS3Abin17]HDK41756.1 hypothetical protein [Candidatus Pacearchaeota archaeon]HDZ60605.1 hypothetical protein [Candidatus Pacearchaeota archaeon]